MDDKRIAGCFRRVNKNLLSLKWPDGTRKLPVLIAQLVNRLCRMSEPYLQFPNFLVQQIINYIEKRPSSGSTFCRCVVTTEVPRLRSWHHHHTSRRRFRDLPLLLILESPGKNTGLPALLQHIWWQVFGKSLRIVLQKKIQRKVDDFFLSYTNLELGMRE